MMELSKPDQVGFYLLAALFHLEEEKKGLIHGLNKIQIFALNTWGETLSLRGLVTSKRFLVENELIEERVLGYMITGLGIEYLQFHRPNLASQCAMVDSV
jgi:hypothetical protein